MIVWFFITKLGDAAVMLPCALGLAALLAAGRERILALWWCLLFFGAMFIVSASKIAFVGWGVGVKQFAFTGFSGHAMCAMALFPTLFCLILHGQRAVILAGGFMLGVALALLVAMSRLTLHTHSVSEVLSGALLGLVVCAAFVVRLARTAPGGQRNYFIALLGLVFICALYVQAAPTMRLVYKIAATLARH